MSMIENIPPAFPVPVLPQSFDTSLSYYELLAKLTESINLIANTVNQHTALIQNLQIQMQNVPSMSEVTDAIAAEASARESADNALLLQITAIRNWATAEFVLESDLTSLYLAGTINFELISKEAYDALTEYTPGRVYFVVDGDSFTIHYGDSIQPQRAQAVNATGVISTPSVRSFSANVIQQQDETVDLESYNFSVVSSFNDNTGAITPSASTTGSKIATLEYIPISEGVANFTPFVTASGHDMQFFVYYYDAQKNFLGLGATDSYVDGGTMKTRYYSGTAYIRLGFRANSSLPSVSITEITKSDLEMNVF